MSDNNFKLAGSVWENGLKYLLWNCFNVMMFAIISFSAIAFVVYNAVT